MGDDLARVLLSRMERDFDRSHAILRCSRWACTSRSDLASGPWGVALALAEMAREMRSEAWGAAARRLADTPGLATGRGLFSGPEGQHCAREAASQCMEDGAPVRLLASSASLNPDGDLIDGQLGEAWARQCVGSCEEPIAPVDDDNWTGATPGLAHGALGLIACRAPSLAEGELMYALETHAAVNAAGWCNGLSGTAVTAVLGGGGRPSSAVARAAKRYVRIALAQIPLPTDGLCHGSAGVLAVGAAVARCTGDKTLGADVAELARAHWAACRLREWRLDPGLVSDQSWLTGAAGVAWAQMVVIRRPLINPLCPTDSILARNRMGLAWRQ